MDLVSTLALSNPPQTLGPLPLALLLFLDLCAMFRQQILLKTILDESESPLSTKYVYLY